MDIQEQRHGAVTVLKPKGALTETEITQFRQHLGRVMSSSLGRVAVDASEMPFVDSAGLEALLEATEQMSRSGQALKLCAANETVREVLDLTELSSQFEHFEDVKTAVRSFL